MGAAVAAAAVDGGGEAAAAVAENICCCGRCYCLEKKPEVHEQPLFFAAAPAAAGAGGEGELALTQGTRVWVILTRWRQHCCSV